MNSYLKSPLIWIVAVVIVLGLWSVSAYNNLVTLNEAADAQWAQVETQYQRRLDLIPNLVESVKGIFEQEQEVFGAIAEARTRYTSAQTPDERAAAANQVESALARLIAVVENYPQLRSSENVTRLMDELAGTENRVSVERGRYNERVQEYNLAVKRFPARLFAAVFGFDERVFFKAKEGADQAPEVDF